jgi:hypothetical protein
MHDMLTYKSLADEEMVALLGDLTSEFFTRQLAPWRIGHITRGSMRSVCFRARPTQTAEENGNAELRD